MSYSVECVVCGDKAIQKTLFSCPVNIYTVKNASNHCSSAPLQMNLPFLVVAAVSLSVSLSLPLFLFSHIKTEFSAVELITFEESTVEFTTDRIYCAAPYCRRFILSPHIFNDLDRALCQECSTETCLHCRTLAHGGECAADQNL
jgi:hypothetical protein